MNLGLGAPVTLALLAGNGFFVATEFALVAARRPRLERAAVQDQQLSGRLGEEESRERDAESLSA
ncbi:hypothetical protein [Actinomadura sp. NPDC049753]|uniref:hypothetical protein n=1 Tax=Actinomadura sp. NPDC049753 TaxID=3154739 RepID=UPI00343D8A55